MGTALERALNYPQKAEGFDSAIAKLQPHLTNIINWLGGHWQQLLNQVI